jgi:hypothetical protein
MIDPTVAITISTIFLTKTLEGSGEELGKVLLGIVGQSISKIFQYSAKIARALESGDPQVLNLDKEVLAQIPSDPIFAELLDAASAEQNAKFKEKFQALKADNITNIIGKQINITQGGTGNTQINKNTFNF